MLQFERCTFVFQLRVSKCMACLPGRVRHPSYVVWFAAVNHAAASRLWSLSLVIISEILLQRLCWAWSFWSRLALDTALGSRWKDLWVSQAGSVTVQGATRSELQVQKSCAALCDAVFFGLYFLTFLCFLVYLSLSLSLLPWVMVSLPLPLSECSLFLTPWRVRFILQVILELYSQKYLITESLTVFFSLRWHWECLVLQKLHLGKNFKS